MPAHYATLKAQLKADLYTALGATAVLVFGRPRRAIETYPNARILTRIPREFQGVRSVQENYAFDIEVRLDLPSEGAYPEDGSEELTMAAADTLLDLLAPFDTASMPTPAGPYAGVGTYRRVSEVRSLDTRDEDGYIGYRMTFECFCTVNQ